MYFLNRATTSSKYAPSATSGSSGSKTFTVFPPKGLYKRDIQINMIYSNNKHYNVNPRQHAVHTMSFEGKTQEAKTCCSVYPQKTFVFHNHNIRKY